MSMKQTTRPEKPRSWKDFDEIVRYAVEMDGYTHTIERQLAEVREENERLKASHAKSVIAMMDAGVTSFGWLHEAIKTLGDRAATARAAALEEAARVCDEVAERLAKDSRERDAQHDFIGRDLRDAQSSLADQLAHNIRARAQSPQGGELGGWEPLEARAVMNMLHLDGEQEGHGKRGAEKLRAIIDGLIEQRARAAAAEKDAERLRGALISLRPFIEEVWSAHRDDRSPDYNACEEHECEWCVQTRAALSSERSPGSRG